MEKNTTTKGREGMEATKDEVHEQIRARLDDIVSFLDANKTDCWTIKDEPWMHFGAEVERYGQTFVRVGYYFEEAGDICYDPNLEFVIREGRLVKVNQWHWLTDSHSLDDDLAYASDFLDLVWQRHFQPRLKCEHSTCASQGKER